MPTLSELKGRPKVAKQEFIDALEALASDGKELGLLVEVREVIAILDRCNPPLIRKDLEMLKGYCRRASTDLEHSGKSWAAQEWTKILETIESRLGQMPR